MIKKPATITLHRLTWRMFYPVYINAYSREQAIAEAIRTKPDHIPAGTELHYGSVGSSATRVAVAS